MNPEVTPQQLKEILAGMVAPDTAIRRKASATLLSQAASAIPLLADFMESAERTEAKASKTAMEQLVHSLLTPPPGKDRPDGGVCFRVSGYLMEIAQSPRRPRMTRAHCLYLLGFSGGPQQEKALEELEKDKEVGEDARMARKRIRSIRY